MKILVRSHNLTLTNVEQYCTSGGTGLHRADTLPVQTAADSTRAARKSALSATWGPFLRMRSAGRFEHTALRRRSARKGIASADASPYAAAAADVFRSAR
jgi:hypothetical protein